MNSKALFGFSTLNEEESTILVTVTFCVLTSVIVRFIFSHTNLSISTDKPVGFYAVLPSFCA